VNQGALPPFTIWTGFVLQHQRYCAGVTLQFGNSQEILLKKPTSEQMLEVLVSSFGQEAPRSRLSALWLLCPFRIDTAGTKAF
jgi:hypothetical protein